MPAGPNNTTPTTFGASTSYCDPLYPYQPNTNFEDTPRAPYPNGSFRGIALLSTVTQNAGPLGNQNILTVYDGVSYGFDVYVTPEPGALSLMVAGLVALGAWRRAKSRGGGPR